MHQRFDRVHQELGGSGHGSGNAASGGPDAHWTDSPSTVSLGTRGAEAAAVVIVTPDASVLLKWVLPDDDEPDGDAALSLRDYALAGAVELVVPQLWIYEVGNTRSRTQALSLAVSYGVACYDAAYHVALVHGGVFVIADERCPPAPRERAASRRCGSGARDTPIASPARSVAWSRFVRDSSARPLPASPGRPRSAGPSTRCGPPPHGQAARPRRAASRAGGIARRLLAKAGEAARRLGRKWRAEKDR